MGENKKMVGSEVMKEEIIVTLTTWSKRIGNIPYVLDTIYGQTVSPDKVVLNLAYDEVVPADVQNYIDEHDIEVNRMPDWKVYKKLIPTLKKYPDACIISIDDDWLYPEGMIEDFMSIHNQYPDFPISGNKEVIDGLQCHCGCASLTKASYFGEYLSVVDDDVMMNCPSDDMVYTYLASKTGHPYIRTVNEYFFNMQAYNATEGYSHSVNATNPIVSSMSYLEEHFGKIEVSFAPYMNNKYLTSLFDDICNKRLGQSAVEMKKQTEDRIYATYSFRIGQAIVKPFRWLKGLLSCQANQDVKEKKHGQC